MEWKAGSKKRGAEAGSKTGSKYGEQRRGAESGSEEQGVSR